MAETDNTIALGVKTVPPTQVDPLATIEKFTNIQQGQNQLKLFQQTFAARQKAGQILATSKDLEDGLQRMTRDPLVAPFAGEIVNSYRQMQSTMAELEGKYQTQATSGFDAFMKTLPAVAADPSSWDKMANATLGTLSPEARKRVAPAMEQLKLALTDGLDKLPEDQRQMQFQQRMNGMLLAGGLTPDIVKGIYGTPGELDLGGRVQPTVTLPSAVGGGQIPVGSPFGKSLAPTVVTGPYGEGGAQVPTVMGGGGGGSGGGAARSAPVAGGSSNPLGAGSGGARSAGLSGPTMSDSQYMTTRGTKMADYEEDLDSRVTGGASLRKNMGGFVEAAKKAETGGGAEAYMKLGQALQSIGVENETVDKIANGSLDASQVMNKIASTNMTAGQIRQQLGGLGSRLNMQEFTTYLNNNPNLTTDPRAWSQIFQLWNSIYDRDKAEQTALDKFKSGKPTGDAKLDAAIGEGRREVARWPSLWARSSFMEGYAPSGPIDTSGTKGNEPKKGITAADRQRLLDKYGSGRK